jgi:hypothetical protein
LPPFPPFWVFISQCLVLYLKQKQKQLSKSNSSNSFNWLSMYVVWETLFGAWRSIADSLFDSWIYTQSSRVWFSMSMLTSINYSFCCEQVFSSSNIFFSRCTLMASILPWSLVNQSRSIYRAFRLLWVLKWAWFNSLYNYYKVSTFLIAFSTSTLL